MPGRGDDRRFEQRPKYQKLTPAVPGQELSDAERKVDRAFREQVARARAYEPGEGREAFVNRGREIDEIERWEAYLYPKGGRGEPVMRNLAGVRTQAAASQIELANFLTARGEIERNPPLPATLHGLQDTHRALFGRTYAWAGKLRDVKMSKQVLGDDGRLRRETYGDPQDLAADVNAQMRRLDQRLPMLHRLGREARPERMARETGAVLARHLGELHRLHPFREGNGRTLQAHADAVARQVGLRFDGARLDAESWNAGRREVAANQRDIKGFAKTIGGVLVPDTDRARASAGERVEVAGDRQLRLLAAERAKRPEHRDPAVVARIAAGVAAGRQVPDEEREAAARAAAKAGGFRLGQVPGQPVRFGRETAEPRADHIERLTRAFEERLRPDRTRSREGQGRDAGQGL